jgi:cytochrome-b5 reductase
MVHQARFEVNPRVAPLSSPFLRHRVQSRQALLVAHFLIVFRSSLGASKQGEQAPQPPSTTCNRTMTGMTTTDPTLLWATTIGLATVGLVLAYVLTTNGKKKPKTFLPMDDFVAIPLIRKDRISHDVVKFTFALPSPEHILGLPTGQHLTLKFVNATTGQAVQRSYTPVSYAHTRGEVSFVIKVYRPSPPQFPTGGQMSQHLDALAIGDTILVYGPKGHVDWQGGGLFHTKPLGKPKEIRQAQTFCFIAGGTGITPMLQILHTIFVEDDAAANSNDAAVSVKLLYANQTEDDILVRDELEALQKKYPDRFSLWYTVDRVASKATSWSYDTGFINKSMIEQHGCFRKSSSIDTTTQFFLCGPPPMIKFACLPALTELGYTEKNWVIF